MKKLVPRAHIEPANGTPEQNKHYCTKPVEGCSCKHCKDCPARLDGPWEFGQLPTQGSRSDIKDCIKSIKKRGLMATARKRKHEATVFKYIKGAQWFAQMAKQKPRDPDIKVTLIIGNPGTGKTRYVYEQYPWKDIYKQEAGSHWFDGYENQSVALLDDFSGAASGWRLDYLLQFLDRYDMRLPIKGSFTWFHAQDIFITTNLHPYTWFGWEGRGIHYWALMRRIHEVRVINDDSTHVMGPGSAEWERFWGKEWGPKVGDKFPRSDPNAWKVNMTSFGREAIEGCPWDK